MHQYLSVRATNYCYHNSNKKDGYGPITIIAQAWWWLHYCWNWAFTNISVKIVMHKYLALYHIRRTCSKPEGDRCGYFRFVQSESNHVWSESKTWRVTFWRV